MRHYDSTQTMVVCCHDLARDAAPRYIQATSWKDALDVLWPYPYCVILRRPGEEHAFLAARLMRDRDAITFRPGKTPEEAREALRKEWQRHVSECPEEMPARCLRPALRLLEARGFQINGRWNDLLCDIAVCGTYGQACEVMDGFLRRAVPWLNERDRFRVMLRLEELPFAAMRQAAGA